MHTVKCILIQVIHFQIEFTLGESFTYTVFCASNC